MTCPNCGKEYSYGSTCPYCNVDTVLFTGTVRTSDTLYNKALGKIKVSDLSGAVDCLSKSIYINKNNTQARNLLGLIQYEIGHVGEALKNWVISCGLQKEDNPAATYIETIQKNSRALERLNDSIRIYNQALNDIWQKSDDMAIIKLKQAVDLNPKFVDALNLLSFCYLIQKDKSRALSTAERVLAIDVNNTIALSYYNELAPAPRIGGGKSRRKPAAAASEPQNTPVTPYKKVVLHERRNVNFHIEGILALVIGVVITLGVVFVLVLPALDRGQAVQMSDMQERLLQTEEAFEYYLQERDQTITEQQGRINRLEAQVDEWAQMYYAQERTFDILHAFELLRDGRLREAVDALGGVDMEGLPPDIAERANEIRAVAYPQLAQQYFSEGFAAYHARPPDLEKARVDFERAHRYARHLGDNPLRGDVLYYLGWTYSRLDMIEEAIEYFERMIEDFPNHRYTWHAQNRLNAIR